MSKTIMSDELKKGDKVFLSPIKMISNEPRRGEIRCNKKGIRRMVKIEKRDGYYDDVGDVYVDEILSVVRDEFEYEFLLNERHEKIMKDIRQAQSQF